MKKVLIGNLNGQSNGDMAVLTGILNGMREISPNIHYTILITSPEKIESRYGPIWDSQPIEFITPPWYAERKSRLGTIVQTGFNLVIFSLFKRGFFKKYDLYIELGTDTHTPYYGLVAFYASYSIPVMCILARQPYVLCAESVGPFPSPLYRIIAKFIFRRAELITIRDEISGVFLKNLGIAGFQQGADLAFLLEPDHGERIDEIFYNEGIDFSSDQPIIGMAASNLIHSYFLGITNGKDYYVQLMANLTDYIITKTGATVIFISHDTSPGKNDQLIHQEIYYKVKNKEKAHLINTAYTTGELKGIIGRCNLFIGSRMHSTIAAVSTFVPTIALSYSHKFQGVLGQLLDPDKFIIRVDKISREELEVSLYSTIEYVWQNRQQIRQELEQRMIKVKKKAQLNAELVSQLLNSLSSSK